MKSREHSRSSWSIVLLAAGLLAAVLLMACPAAVRAQGAAVTALLARARVQDESGHIELAAQGWQQVLLAEPNNREAIAGLARWAKLAGNDAQAEQYLQRLRRLDPHDAAIGQVIGQVQGMRSTKEQNAQLQQASKLAQSGQNEAAMKIYRSVWGDRPPDGDWALAYYDTEAGIEASRPEAIERLRELSRRYPADARYKATLGRILTYGPATRSEGERLLEELPQNPAAQAALRQALLWDAQRPGAGGEIKAFLKQHPDETLEKALTASEAHQAEASKAQNTGMAHNAAEREAFAALAANRTEDAEARFGAIHDAQPENPRALAGLGFVRMKQGKFDQAIEYLDASQQKGMHERDVDNALKTARFWLTMQQGTAALNDDRLDEAGTKYKDALVMRPNAPEALQGLSGVYMKAGEPAKAVALDQQIVRTQPRSVGGWRGLFDAEVQAGQWNAALDTVKRLPAAVKAELGRDPGYLRDLASAYGGSGDADAAQQTLAQALKLPFPNGGQGMKAETRLQYADLLVAAQRYAQAAGMFRAVLDDDPESVRAWQGLIAAQHQAGHDAEAVETVERMDPMTYEDALRDAGFLSTLAGVYQAQNRFDVAMQLLQREARQDAEAGKAVPLEVQLQLAAIYLQRGDLDPAYTLYRGVLAAHPERVDGWKGLLSVLHQTGRDQDALAQMRELPPVARRALEQDVSAEQTIASIYAATDNGPAAMQMVGRIEAQYRGMHKAVPAEVEMQNAWLRYNLHDERDLYRTLMDLGGRDDLSDAQRRTVQTIWAQWSVRRAGEASDRGNNRQALEILSAAAEAFPGNPAVAKALAGGYLQAGEAKRALAIYEALDLRGASPQDYEAMVGAALAVPDMKQAERWLREALDRFPKEARVLEMAARFEQVRGDHKRAAAFWKASVDAMPEVNPGSKLAHLLDQPGAPKRVVDKNLASLLDPDSAVAGRPLQPPLPSYRGAGAGGNAAPREAEQAALYGPDPYSQGTAPVPWNTGVSEGNAAPATGSRESSEQLGAYVPQAQVRSPITLRPSGENESRLNESQANEDAQAFAPPSLSGEHGADAAAAVQAAREPVERPANQPLRSARTVAEQPVALAATSSTSAAFPARPVPGAAPEDRVLRRLSDKRPVEILAENADAPQVQFLRNSAVSLTLTPVQMRAPQPQADAAMATAVASSDTQRQEDLPLLRASDSAIASVRPVDPRTAAQRQIDVIAGGYSPWAGGSGYATHRTGTAGLDALTVLEAPFELSGTAGEETRFTVVVMPSFLDSGTADGTSQYQLGTAAVGATPGQQVASGVGGEVQLTTANFGLSAGVSPYGFLVTNWTGRLNWRPAAGHVTFNFSRDAVKDSQLSYAGLHDPGTASATSAGNVWGGVVADTANVQYAKSEGRSGYYFGMGGQYLTGRNVLSNQRIDGLAGAYFKVLRIPGTGELTMGTNFFGMHYEHNLRFFTYGQGGYFSPNAYFLANLPFTFDGNYGRQLHYTVGGAFGVQAFQEASSLYFPLQGAYTTKTITLQPGSGPVAPAPTVVANPSYPAQLVVGGNYDFHAEMSYHLMDRWYLGGFVSFNNTRNYESQTAGFFLRYTVRPQYPDEAGPTGLFPYQGFRPVMVP
jgi:predicted Zn-dependent protease